MSPSAVEGDLNLASTGWPTSRGDESVSSSWFVSTSLRPIASKRLDRPMT